MVDIVTKGNICLGVLSFCFNADDSVNLTFDKMFQSDYLGSLQQGVVIYFFVYIFLKCCF